MDSHEANPNHREVVVARGEVERTIRDDEHDWDYVGTVDAPTRDIPEHSVRILLRGRCEIQSSAAEWLPIIVLNASEEDSVSTSGWPIIQDLKPLSNSY